MEIASVESFSISIPLDEPVAFATRVLERRDHAITFVRTAGGVEGVGYTLGYDGAGLIADAVETLLAPIVEGEDPRDTERLWREMFDGTVQIGRKGLLLRAISTVDMALWDVKAKAAEMPLYKLLGGYADAVPTYASGGYYRDEEDRDGEDRDGEDRDGEGHDALRAEMRRYVEAGHDVVKMKVGRLPLADEVERVRAVREKIGDERTLLLDANGAWSTKGEALRACRAFAPYDPYFIEEPVMPDSVELMARVNADLDYGVAAGELEFSRYGFAHLLETGAVDVIQPDVTVVGGITEWLRVAHAAAMHDVPVAPHYNWNVHSPLFAAIENGLWIEYFYRDTGVKVFDDVVVDPLAPDEEGRIHLPDRAGHGVELDKVALDRFREAP